ncbi:MAG: hypothetical protein KBD83_04270 [Gammaproteobacteria bacterium]|nr:hypothetical protein [Gammaproteobacteria bacterium]
MFGPSKTPLPVAGTLLGDAVEEGVVIVEGATAVAGGVLRVLGLYGTEFCVGAVFVGAILLFTSLPFACVGALGFIVESRWLKSLALRSLIGSLAKVSGEIAVIAAKLKIVIKNMRIIHSPVHGVSMKNEPAKILE